MKTITRSEAEQYLKEHPFSKLKVILSNGERRNVTFLNYTNNFFIFKKGSSRRGWHIDNLSGYTTILAPSKKRENPVVEKFIKKAKKASFTNSFIRNCLNADINKSAYENHLTTGVAREGEVITLDAIAKADPYIAARFREAFKNGEEYNSPRIRFRGYDMSVSTKTYENGDKWGWLSMEYKDCGNGHYYLLINDNDFIYTDKD